jgi:hypothetical protein
MHPNAQLLVQLYDSLNRRSAAEMAACYHPAATFRDIAFNLSGKDEISAMWRMICCGDISATYEIVHANEREGVAQVVDDYTFTDTGRHVRNPIESRFLFQDALIIEHVDVCDPRDWAAAALGGVTGFVAGRVRLLRAWKARKKLKLFLQHPSGENAPR